MVIWEMKAQGSGSVYVFRTWKSRPLTCILCSEMKTQGPGSMYNFRNWKLKTRVYHGHSACIMCYRAQGRWDRWWWVWGAKSPGKAGGFWGPQASKTVSVSRSITMSPPSPPFCFWLWLCFLFRLDLSIRLTMSSSASCPITVKATGAKRSRLPSCRGSGGASPSSAAGRFGVPHGRQDHWSANIAGSFVLA